MKKFLIILVTCVLTVLCLSGCGQSDVESDKNITNQLNSGTYSTEDNGTVLATTADDSIMIRTDDGVLMTLASDIDIGWLSFHIVGRDLGYSDYERGIKHYARMAIISEAAYWSYTELRDNPDRFQQAVNERLIRIMMPQVTLTLPKNKE